MITELEDDVERIHLHFPAMNREEMSLRSEQGTLCVGLNGREQEIPTESYVKSSQVKASLNDDVLSLDIPRSDSPS